MKANRKVMLGAALVVAIVALAGVGYAAAVGYKAETSTTLNSVNDEYLVIYVDDGSYTTQISKAYGFDTQTTYNGGVKVSFDTCYDLSDNNSPKAYTKYADNAGNVSTAETGAVYKMVSVKDVTLTVDFKNAISAGAASVKLDLIPSTDPEGSVTTNGNAIKLFVVYDNKVITFTDNSATFTVDKNGEAPVTATLSIYVAAPVAAQTLATFTNDAFVNVGLKFTASADDGQ